VLFRSLFLRTRMRNFAQDCNDCCADDNSSAQQRMISKKKLHAVSYDTENHVKILTQLHGSVWPRVLPYCCCNIIITSVIYYLRHHRDVDLTCSDRGHTFMALMVSFLVVTRSNIAYSRFMEARELLNQAMKACRELTQHMITFTRYEHKPRAKQWRAEIARRTVVLLRTVVSVLEVSSLKWLSAALGSSATAV